MRQSFVRAELILLLLLSFLPLCGENLYPDNLLMIGQEKETAFLVEKRSQKMYLYQGNNPNPLMVFTITTGKNGGNKMSEGDEKTPLGIYFFTKTMEDDELPPLYGLRAFVMDYPNAVDTFQQKRGSGIWLHGSDDPFKPLTPFSTRGCVAMKNADLGKVSSYITLDKTPIITVEEIRFRPYKEVVEERDLFLNLLESWRKGWESRQIDKYITHYHPLFRMDNFDYVSYKKFKERLNSLYSFIKVDLEDIQIIKAGDYVVTSFYQVYQSDKKRFVGVKRLYWVKDGGRWKILREISLPNKRWTPPKSTLKQGGKWMSVEDFRWENDPLQGLFRLNFTVKNGLKSPMATYLVVKVLGPDGSGYLYSREGFIPFSPSDPILPLKKGKLLSLTTAQEMNIPLQYEKGFYPSRVEVQLFDPEGILLHSETITI